MSVSGYGKIVQDRDFHIDFKNGKSAVIGDTRAVDMEYNGSPIHLVRDDSGFDFSPNNPFTINMWFKRTPTNSYLFEIRNGSNNQCVYGQIAYGAVVTLRLFLADIVNGADLDKFWKVNSSKFPYSGVSTPFNMITFTWDGGTTDDSLKLYINGVEETDLGASQSSGTFVSLSSSSVSYIGGAYNTADSTNGAWDNFNVYSKASTPQEVYAMYYNDGVNYGISYPKIFETITIPKFGVNFQGTNSSNHLISTSANYNWSGNKPFTFSFWYKYNGNNNPLILFRTTGVNTSNSIYLQYNDSTERITCILYQTTNTVWFREEFDVTLDTDWHYHSYTWDGGNTTALAGNVGGSVKYYVDGVEITIAQDTQVQGVFTDLNNVNGFTLGNNLAFGSPSMDGVIDELAIYDKAINLAQHQALYNIGNGQDLASADQVNLISWHSFNTSLTDDDFASNDFTIVGSVGFNAGKVGTQDVTTLDVDVECWLSLNESKGTRHDNTNNQRHFAEVTTANEIGFTTGQVQEDTTFLSIHNMVGNQLPAPNNDNFGVPIGSPTVTDGVLNLNGVDQYVDFGDIISNHISTTGTMECWFKTSVSDSGYMAGFCSISNTNFLGLRCNSGKVGTALRRSTIGGIDWVLQTNSIVINDNDWNYAAVIQNGVEPVLIVNGVEYSFALGNASYVVASPNKDKWIDSTLEANTDKFTMGALEYNNAIQFNFNGSISDYKIYNRALSLLESQQNYNNTKARKR